jgi:hypothetical protein
MVIEIRNVLEKDSTNFQNRQLRLSFESENLNTVSKILLQGIFAYSLSIRQNNRNFKQKIVYIYEALDLSARGKYIYF